MSSFGDLSGLLWVTICPGACEEEGRLDLVGVQDFQEVGQSQTVASGAEGQGEFGVRSFNAGDGQFHSRRIGADRDHVRQVTDGAGCEYQRENPQQRRLDMFFQNSHSMKACLHSI